MSELKASNNDIFSKIVDLLKQSKQKVITYVNKTIVLAYFEIGKLIVEEQQNGNDRAEYGTALLKQLSNKLTKEFGRGYSVDNLENMRRFYLVYGKSETLSPNLNKSISETTIRKSKNNLEPIHDKDFNLSWSHYLTLMRIDNVNERQFYEIESFKNNWSVRELKRQYNSALFTRLSLSKDKEGVIELSNSGNIVETPSDLIKDPYVLEFLGLPEAKQYSENDLEKSIIDKLEHFLLELGNGFTFVARQKRISFDDKHFYIDLVFYNRLIKSFVLIDLKIGELKHQDIGQMQMYVNYYDRKIKLKDENKTIGIILCQNKSDAVVEFTLPEDKKQIFASKYLTVLPTKDEFKKILIN